MSALISVAALLGLFVGSFLNVVIHRVPLDQSVVRPRSHCPECGAVLAGYDNVPVLSWVVLRGRCRSCRAPISVRYPIVELLTAGSFAVIAWRFGAHPELVAYLYLAAIGVALAAIDIDTQRLPVKIVRPAYVTGAVLLVTASVLKHDPGALVRAALACAALYAFYLLLVAIYPAGMGFGDVRLSGVLGLYLGWIGWDALIVGGFGGFLLGGLGGVVLLSLGRAGRKTSIPFGPYMILGCLVGVMWGHQVAAWYTGVLGI
jgi:leader peptidase (prepilin peptidase) / N-methyltransferase